MSEPPTRGDFLGYGITSFGIAAILGGLEELASAYAIIGVMCLVVFVALLTIDQWNRYQHGEIAHE